MKHGLATAICAVLAIVHPIAQQPRASLEGAVKAAFLYQFIRYVEWPPKGLPDGSGPFRVCTVADGAFDETLDKVLEGETAGGRPLIRVTPETPQEARRCQILFISKDDVARGEILLESVLTIPVLTVSDAPDFLHSGGQIRMLRDDNRIRFDVNLPAVKRSGLTLRSQLLRLARQVTTDPGGRP